jgi:hypothetical protein
MNSADRIAAARARARLPDIVANGQDYHRSRRIRLALFGLASLALILAAGAFALGLAATSHNASKAVDDANAATARANRAAAAAEAAVRSSVYNRTHLCAFLHVTAVTAASRDLRSDAKTLLIAYRCKM